MKKARQVMSKVKRMIIIFLDIKGIVQKELILAGQTANSAYYCDVLWQVHENVWRHRPEIWQQMLHQDIAPLLTMEFFTKSNITDVLTHPTCLNFPLQLSCSPDWIYCHFDTTEMTEEESQAVFNMTSRRHLNNGISAGNSAYCRRGLLWGRWWPVKPKVGLWPDYSISPGNYGQPWYISEHLYDEY